MNEWIVHWKDRRDVHIRVNVHALLIEGNFSDVSAHIITPCGIKTMPTWDMWTNQTKW
jgi:hypothetical protein